MTHEFKTPLASILIASQYATNQEEIKNHPKLSKYMQIITQQSQKLNQHIERILNVAKGDAKWIELEKKSIPLLIALEQVKENTLLKTTKNCSITINVSEKILVNADEFHFNNILFNIIDNAVKYSPIHPEITINGNETEKGLLLKFSDNGIGIDPQHIDYVFDKFYRVPRENKKDIEGFGIGLFYVKKIIDLHKWKIAIQNNPLAGITISIFIPKNDLS